MVSSGGLVTPTDKGQTNGEAPVQDIYYTHIVFLRTTRSLSERLDTVEHHMRQRDATLDGHLTRLDSTRLDQGRQE